jgi:hypothetical protein
MKKLVLTVVAVAALAAFVSAPAEAHRLGGMRFHRGIGGGAAVAAAVAITAATAAAVATEGYGYGYGPYYGPYGYRYGW